MAGPLHRWRKSLGVATAVVLGSTIIVVTPEVTWADPVRLSPALAGVVQAADPSQPSVPVGAVRATSAPMSQSETAAWTPPAVRWPAAGAAEVDVPVRPGAIRGARGTPLSVGRVAPESAAADLLGRVRVEVLGRPVAAAAGIQGVLLRVRRTDGVAAPGRVWLSVDVSGFAGAFGADWASRVRLVRFPACVLTTPRAPGCATPTPVESTVTDSRRLRVSGTVSAGPLSASGQARKLGQVDDANFSAEAVIGVLAAGASSDTGDFTKTPYKASYEWQAGGSSAEFGWSYDMPVPPVPGGLVPDVSLGYSSGSVDAQTAGENVQPGWLGEGWEYSPGFVERTYRACADDQLPVTPNYTNATGDMCWRLPNARLVWGGKSSELIPDDATGVWHAANDDGTKVELLADGADWNAANVVFAREFDGDGKADLLFRRWSNSDLYLVRGDGAGGWLNGGAATNIGTFGSADIIFSPGDFSGDGKPDVLWRRASDGTLWMLKGNGSGGWISGTSTQIGAIASANAIFGGGDFSGDGKTDVLWRRASDGVLFMLRGNGLGGWITGSSEQIGTGWNTHNLVFSPGDFTGDGKMDVLARSVSAGNLWLYKGNGAGGWISGTGTEIATGFGSADALFSGGDHDGDGKADVLWRVGSTKDVLLLAGNGTGGWKTGSSINITDPVRLKNGDDNGERWRVTTTDGTQYYFGQARLPNWSAGKRETNSVMTVPMFANHELEPCYRSSGFTTSWCSQAWRWNLDYVVDRFGNSMAYFYTRNPGKVGLAGNANSVTTYDRGNSLDRIEYGMRVGQELATTTPPARVVFSTAERCLSSCWAGTPWASAPTTANWPDTPWDLDCQAAPCSGNLTPSFWTPRRLASVASQTWSGSGSTYHTVDQWDLTHTFPSTGNGTSPVLWLASIGRTGKANGGSIALPTVSLGGTRFDQRADYDPNGTMAQPRKYRITAVDTETGGRIAVAYGGQDSGCQFGSPFPNPDTNSRRCFPQWYKPQQAPAGWSWWHKYIVSSVTEKDLVGGSPDVVHSYVYSTAGASTSVLWSHDDGPATWGAPLARRSWANWRGYPTVTVTTGPVGNQAQTKYLYFRGLKDDYTDTGENRASTITNSAGEVWQDYKSRAGHPFEVIEYATPGGQQLTRTIHDPTRFQTGQRVLSSTWAIPTVHTSYINRTSIDRTWIWLAATSTWRTTRLVNTWDPTYGVITAVNDQGDTATTADDLCTRTWYTYNLAGGKYLVDFPNRTATVGVDCATTPSYPADAVRATRYFYDGSATHGSVPATGTLTKIEQAASYTGSVPNWIKTATAGFDQWGRVTSVGDALDRITNTVYTQGGHGLTTTVKVTNPALHETTTTLDVAWGSPLTVTDPNGNMTTGSYDALGRLLKVWLPGRATNLTPNSEFGYTVSKTVPNSIVTKALSPNDTQILTYDIVDGLLRLRQAQTTAPDANRVIADTAYDGRGLVVKSSTFYNNASGPSSTLASFTDAAVGRQVRSTYDGLGRVLTSQLWSLGVEKWRTTISYDGDRTNVDPPTGGTATTTITDARDQVVKLRQYTGGAPTGSYDETTYTYDDAGQLSRVTDPATNHWDYTYDLLGGQLTAVDPDSGTRTNTYDNAGQLLTSTDGRGKVLAYAYDSLGRRTAVHDTTLAGPKLAEWVYDTLAKGQLSSSTRYDSGSAYTAAVTGYDPGYRPRGTTVTIPAAEGNLAGTYTTTTMTYKVNGAPATVALPAKGGLPAETITHTYNAAGLADTMTGAASYIGATAYHWDGQVSQLLLGAAGKRVRLSAAMEESTRRLSSQQVDTENQTTPGTYDDKSTNDYAYDPAGNALSVAGKTAGARDQVECFSYDHLRRLTEAWTQADLACGSPQRTGADPYWLTWTYNTTGNRTSEIDHGATGTTTSTYIYPAAGAAGPHTLTQVTRAGQGSGTDSYDYDLAGNTTSRTLDGQPAQTLTWDVEGRLAKTTQSGQDTTFVYDADGNRLLRRESGAVTLYLGGDEYRLDTGTGQVSGTRYYAGVAVRTGAGLTWLAADHHGTNQLAIDSTSLSVTRRRSLPFGGARGTQPGSWPGEKGFVGGTKDATTGLTHLGARDYDPTIGRFISPDPIQDLTDPQQMHGFAYAHSNPLAFVDPTGLRDCADDDCKQYTTPKPGGGKTIRGTPSPPRAKPLPPCAYTDSCGDNANVHKNPKPRKPAPRKPSGLDECEHGPCKPAPAAATPEPVRVISCFKICIYERGDQQCIAVPSTGRRCGPPSNLDQTLREHLKLQGAVCALLCVQLSFQSGRLSMHAGLGGPQFTGGLFWSSAKVEDQGSVKTGACAVVGGGVCYSVGPRVDRNGEWVGAHHSVGVVAGGGLPAPNVQYKIFSWDIPSGEVSGPQDPFPPSWYRGGCPGSDYC